MIGKKAIQKQLFRSLRDAIPLIVNKEQAIDCMIQIARCEKAHLFSGVEVEQLKALCQEKINELDNLEGENDLIS